jgi:hypothetical protein
MPEADKKIIDAQIKSASLAPEKNGNQQIQGTENTSFSLMAALDAMQQKYSTPKTEKEEGKETQEPHPADPQAMSIRERQKQVKNRVGPNGQPINQPRLAQDHPQNKQPASPAPKMAGGALKKAAGKWAKIALPLGSGGIGGLISYFIS